MNLQMLNLNLLKSFEVTYRHANMTSASKELFMTQSAVSQNIKLLEETLEIQLFDRLKRRLIPTHKAHELYQSCVPVLRDLESALNNIAKQSDQQLSGLVSLGLPVEYGNNVVLPLLSRFGKGHPDLRYEIRYGHANEMNSALIKGELDFAIVDSFGMDKRIGQHFLGTETLALCSSYEYFQKNVSQNVRKAEQIRSYERLDYIDYVSDAPVLKQWFQHHFGDINVQLNIRASLMNVQGMGRMICAGLGVGILPMHVVQKLKEQGEEIKIFREDRAPLENHLSLATLQGRSRSMAVESTIEYLLSELGENITPDSH